MARRLFIKQLLALIPSVVGLSACSNDEQKPSAKIADAKKSRLITFVDTIVPKDQDLGAVEAGVTAVVEKYLKQKPKDEKLADQFFVLIDDLSIKKFSKNFNELSLEQRENLLTGLRKSRDKNHASAKVVMFRLRGIIIDAYYKSSVAWEMLAFTAPFPNGYPDFNQPPPEL